MPMVCMALLSSTPHKSVSFFFMFILWNVIFYTCEIASRLALIANNDE